MTIAQGSIRFGHGNVALPSVRGRLRAIMDSLRAHGSIALSKVVKVESLQKVHQRQKLKSLAPTLEIEIQYRVERAFELLERAGVFFRYLFKGSDSERQSVQLADKRIRYESRRDYSYLWTRPQRRNRCNRIQYAAFINGRCYGSRLSTTFDTAQPGRISPAVHVTHEGVRYAVRRYETKAFKNNWRFS